MENRQSSESSQELLKLLKHFSRLKWEKTPAQELKPSECELLVLLYTNLGNGTKALQASELSNQLNITPAGVTHLLNPLEESGHINRIKDPSDRRFVLISLSAKGKRLAESLLEEAQTKIIDIANYLGKEDGKTLIRILSSFISYLEKHPLL